MTKFPLVHTVFAGLMALITHGVSAQDSTQKDQRFNLHFQTTYVYQYKPSFHSSYEGKNSLVGHKEEQNSLTATLFLGARLWKGAEFYLNPEIAGGSGLSGALGMGGSSNGETFRVGNPSPTLYLGRAYIMQSFDLGGNVVTEDDDQNQLTIHHRANRLSFQLGKYSLGDLFDNNEFSNSPRTQFMNWALMNNGAWDYAANVRGYTYSFSSSLEMNKMTYRISFATLPVVANGAELNTNFKDSFSIGITGEVTRALQWNGRSGNIRLLGYYNQTHMGNYREALMLPGKPDIEATRKPGRTKWGWGLNMDQEVGDGLGIFARAGWNDGKNETWAFTEIDRSLTAGLHIEGKKWKRIEDHLGLAFVANGVSPDHREYLKRGGYGFILGDGTLRYGTEWITELYYSCKPSKWPIWFTADYQFSVNPGYNKDRGPVNIFSIRAHTEF